MPGILDDEQVDRWLSGAPFSMVSTLLKPYPVEKLEIFRVSTLVNNLKNKSGDNVLPAQIHAKTKFEAMFSKKSTSTTLNNNSNNNNNNNVLDVDADIDDKVPKSTTTTTTKLSSKKRSKEDLNDNNNNNNNDSNVDNNVDHQSKRIRLIGTLFAEDNDNNDNDNSSNNNSQATSRISSSSSSQQQPFDFKTFIRKSKSTPTN